MEEILESIKPVIENAKLVSINNDAIEGLISSVRQEEFHQSEYDSDKFLNDITEESFVGFTLLYNSINFCYWGDPKWTVEINGGSYDGAEALTKALIKAINDGRPLLDPSYLPDMPESDLAEILKGNIEIPLFKERLQLLRELGQIIVREFNNSWVAVVDRGGRDAIGIVKVLVNDMPNIFKDEADYNNHTVKFYKRAQIVPATFAHDFVELGITSIKIKNTDKLTAFADYKVPQILRKLGIFEYSDELADKVDNLTELPAGSPEEVEIRAFTIEAIERVAKEAQKHFPKATPAKMDGILWFRGQKKSPDDKPYHRTRTIWY